jgi:hypothetical protein
VTVTKIIRNESILKFTIPNLIRTLIDIVLKVNIKIPCLHRRTVSNLIDLFYACCEFVAETNQITFVFMGSKLSK